MMKTLLIHGGLWEDLDAARFWGDTGAAGELENRGLDLLMPDRLPRASDWGADAQHLADNVPNEKFVVIAGSNGCSAAARFALGHPGRVACLLLGWPATAGDPQIDHWTRRHLVDHGASPEAVAALLAGRTLRGVTDAELRTLAIPVGLVPSKPENPYHQSRTVESLRSLLPRSEVLAGSVEPPHPRFRPTEFADTVVGWLTRWSELLTSAE